MNRKRREYFKYNFHEVEVNIPKYYGEYNTQKQRYLRSAASQYAQRHGWGKFRVVKDREKNELMLIRLG